MSNSSTRQEHQQLHSINPNKWIVAKTCGSPHVNSMSTSSTQHQHQRVHSTAHSISTISTQFRPKTRSLNNKIRAVTNPQYEYQQEVASSPPSTKHASQKRLLQQNQGLPQVHSISTNSAQHQHQQVHSINPKNRLFKNKGCHKSTA